MSEPGFFSIQHEFTRYLRDPNNAASPSGIDPQRLAVYSNAVMANMLTFMGDNFPIIKSIMEAAAFEDMVRDYIVRHRSKTPLFVELPSEFLYYLERERDHPDDPPFLLELAHFELLENLVSTLNCRLEQIACVADGNVMHGVPVMNPTTQLVRYAFAVHTISLESQPKEIPAQPTFIVAFRDRDHRYGFIDVNPATARALELLLGADELSGEQVMRQVATELQHPDVDAVIAGGQAILARFVERDLILGTAAP